MNNIIAIFIKQLTCCIKVPSIIIQGIMFLIIAAVFMFIMPPDEDYDCSVCIPAYVCVTCEERAADRFEMPFPSQIGMFAVIFIGLALVGSVSGLVLEDKSTTNLRFMAMADVKPFQYLIGTVASVIIVVTGMLIPYALLGGYFGFPFMAIGIAGGFVSILFGIVIGLSRAPILATPISLVLGMGPMIGSFNETAANILRFTFIQQVNIAFSDLDADLTSNFLIIGVNGVVVLLIFIIMHRKNKFNV